ncbi:MAG: Crp/Fnr family transcriptional regulator [Bacteroidales bacterium]|nr:Crp/Fnr family transcriptional regulator [Bacteroidales bacterium]
MATIDLSQCPICKNIPAEEQESFIGQLHCIQKKFKKGDLIFRQGDLCKYLYLLTKGTVKTEMVAEDGSLLTIENIKAPHPLAPAFLFAENNRFPVDVTALEESELLLIPKESVMKLLATNGSFLSNYLSFNAGKTQFLSNKLHILSVKTIKGKLAQYLLEQLKPGNSVVALDKNQTQLAEFFGVARPSLARSLSEMAGDGFLKIEKKQITVLDIKGLKKLLA